MQRLRLRQEGKIKVPEQIRFPDKQVQVNPLPKVTNNQTTEKISNWLTDFLDQPDSKEVLINGLIFLSLITVSIFSNNSEMLPLLLTVGVGTSFFVLYRKQSLFWRSIGITFVSFVVAVFVANIFFNLLASAGLTISFIR